MSSLPPQVPTEQQPSAVPPPILDYATPPIIGLDLKKVAMQQRAIIMCIAAECGIVALLLADTSGPLGIVLYFAFLAVAITGAVVVFMLAISVYNVSLGILLGILSLVPFWVLVKRVASVICKSGVIA